MTASGGASIYLSSGTADVGIYRLPNANTGTPDLSFGNTGPGALNTPMALAFGPDSLLYVLDAGDKRIVSFNADGVYQNGFNLSGSPSGSALAIDPNGRLYTLNEDGGGDIYDIYTGTHIGSLAVPSGFSPDNPGSKASLLYSGGYLYSLPTASNKVFVYAVPEPASSALLIGASTLVIAIARRRFRKA